MGKKNEIGKQTNKTSKCLYKSITTYLNLPKFANIDKKCQKRKIPTK